jgi:V/A-type H+/Na+-transporting ATPase subunit I
MSIAIFKKITLYGLSTDKLNILTQLQNMGCVHLVSINPDKSTSLTSVSTSLVDDIKKAANYLKDSPEQAKPKKSQDQFDAEEIVAATLKNQKCLRAAIDRHDFLRERIKDLSVWGNFKLPSDGEIGDNRLWFYKIKHKDISRIPNDYIIQEIHRDDMFIYLIVISPDEPSADAFPVPRIHTGAISLEILHNEFNEIIEKIDDLNEERRQLTRFRLLLSRKLDHFTDRTSLQQAGQKIDDHKDFFLMQGWIPEDKLEMAQKFCDKHQLGMSAEPPTPDEKPPTLLRTYPWTSAGIELVNFYQTPSYYALDPSFMVFFSFAIFFAIILADAGYGLVIAIFTALFWKWLGKFNASTWLRPLLITICVFSIIYGVMLGSYFGIEVPHQSILGHLKILDINNFNSMMKIAITIGCLHIIVANGMRAWFANHLYLKMQSIGFMILIFGFMVMAWGFMNHNQTVITTAIIILAISFLTLMIFSSDLPVTNVKSFINRVLHGLETLSHISTLFGDILSYLRLFALGLAGASLAVTFNHIAVHIAKSSSYGWMLAILVLLLGQTLNLILSIMGGLIHGLRLNYIEFLKWSVKEEGYSYEPFKKVEVSHE